MHRHRRHSIEFKRQVAQAYMNGESRHGLAKRHDIDRNRIRLWVTKYENGEFDAEVEAATTLHEYEAKIARLERKVGQLTMELDFLKGALEHARGATSLCRLLPAPWPVRPTGVPAHEPRALNLL